MGPSGDALVRRKDEHIDHVLAGKGQGAGASGLDVVRFAHNALPEIDHDAIDTTTSFLGRRLRSPFLISSMTGGPSRAADINAR